MKLHRTASAVICLLALGGLTSSPAPSRAQASGSKTWVGHNQDVEAYLRTAECVTAENFGPGPSVDSQPMARRCILPPGGPVKRMLWQPMTSGPYRGFRAITSGNLAAYELDKLLKLDMLPPVVERDLLGHKGVATFWVENAKVVTAEKPADASERARWDAQRARMAMFDNLIFNAERAPNNTIRDDKWNLVLLDHTRAFGTATEVLYPMPEVDGDLWSRIDKLTRQQLDSSLARWLTPEEITALVARREKMKAEINKQKRPATRR